MSAAPVHVIEDAFHRLQTSHPDSLTDEDLEKAAEVAIWNCDPALRDRVRVSARQGVLTLAGTVSSNAQRQAVAQAVRTLDHDIRQVVDRLDVRSGEPAGNDAGPVPLGQHEFGSEPMLYVTRYCSTDPSSITAAFNDAVHTLDQRFAALGLEPPGDVIVLYRNRLPESLTLDVGYVLPASVPLGPETELKAGGTPAGKMLSAPTPDGAHEVLGTHDQLLEEASRQGLSPGNFAWQRFPHSAILIHPVRLPGPLHLPVA